MMKDVNEDDLKNKEDLHRWKAHGAGHIPLCGIFLIENQVTEDLPHPPLMENSITFFF